MVLKVQKNSPADYAGIRGVAADMNTGDTVLGEILISFRPLSNVSCSVMYFINLSLIALRILKRCRYYLICIISGDVIKKVNEINVNSEADFLSTIDKASVSGDIVELTVLRNIERSAAAIQMESSSQQQALKQQSSSQQKQAPIMKEIKLKLKLKFN